jgi:transaldolase
MKLREMSERFPETRLWCDSAIDDDIELALSCGAVGVTTNPIVMSALFRDEPDMVLPVIEDVISSGMELKTETEILWETMRRISDIKGKKLEAVFDASGGKLGRFTLQTSPAFFRDSHKLIDNAMALSDSKPDLQVKLPVTKAGIAAMEECAYRGLNVTATMAFSVTGAVETAAAIERGLSRREAEGFSTDAIMPYCALFLGRLDDYIKECAAETGVVLPGNAHTYAGVAVFKKAYRIVKERNFRTRLFVGAFRDIKHWSEIIGADCSMTMPRARMDEYNESDVEVVSRIDEPVDEGILSELLAVLQFREAYNTELQTVDDLEHSGVFLDTLEQFSAGYDETIQAVRKVLFIRRNEQ